MKTRIIVLIRMRQKNKQIPPCGTVIETKIIAPIHLRRIGVDHSLVLGQRMVGATGFDPAAAPTVQNTK